MARKSRKVTQEQNKEKLSSFDKIYRTAFYARLSAEESHRSEGTTIENQLNLLRDYIKGKPCFEFVKEYVDDGFTGTRFDRPAFTKMIEDIRAGKIDCVIIKDLSRFGRNYLETGEYLETVLPFFGVRLIAITDGYDSICQSPEDGLQMPLKNLINDMYAKDLSKKITTAFYANQIQGNFVGSIAPYGYKKSEQNHHQLLIDEEVKEVIQNIFLWRAKGESYTEIARKLNQQGILSPSQYKLTKGWLLKNRAKTELWTVSTVSAILKNPVYIGDMEQGIHPRAFYQGKKPNVKPVEERIYVKNTHQPIITRELFETVKMLNQKNKEKFHSQYGKYDGISKEQNLFKEILVCGDCGKTMTLWRDCSGARLQPPKVYYKYICQTYRDLKEQGCTKKKINKKEIEKTVEKAIRMHIQLFLDRKKVLETLNQTKEAKQIHAGYEKEIKETYRRKQRAENRAASLYSDYADGLLNETEYLYVKENYRKQAAEEEQRIQKLQELQKKYENGKKGNHPWETILRQYEHFDSLTEEIIRAFLVKVSVFSENRLELQFRFQDELENLATLVEERKEDLCKRKANQIKKSM